MARRPSSNTSAYAVGMTARAEGGKAPLGPPNKTTSLGLPSIAPGSAEEVKALLAKAPKAADYPNAASAMLLDLMDPEGFL